MVDRLAEDHANARHLAAGLARQRGLHLEPDTVQTNIVIFDVIDRPAREFMDALKSRGVLASYVSGRKVRMVTHYGIGQEDVDQALDVVESVVGGWGRVTR